MNLGPHAGFILLAYAFCFGVLAALLFWVAMDGRTQWRRLKELEQRGVTRRSERA